MMRRFPLPPRLPQTPSRCSYCGEPLLEPRAASIIKVGVRYKLCCRDWRACRERKFGSWQGRSPDYPVTDMPAETGEEGGPKGLP
jgi:hypothetical protein